MVKKVLRSSQNCSLSLPLCKADRGGGVQTGGASRSGLVFPFWDFPDFPGFPNWSFSSRNIPDRVCDTIRTFPERNGKPPSLEPPPVYLLSKITAIRTIAISVAISTLLSRFRFDFGSPCRKRSLEKSDETSDNRVRKTTQT